MSIRESLIFIIGSAILNRSPRQWRVLFPCQLAVKEVRRQENRTMNAQKLKEARQQLSDEYEQLIKSIGRKRLAAEEIQIETTKDECDLATISHEKDVLYHLHEGGFARLRFIRKALESIDRGSYGECAD